MQLYHFTAGVNLRGIARFGLTIGDVPTDFHANAGVVGVWFTTSAGPEGMGLDGSRVDKTRFRLEVELTTETPQLEKWTEWCQGNVTPSTRLALLRTAPAEETWYVLFGKVSADKIRNVVDMANGQQVHNWQTLWPERDSQAGVNFWRRDVWHKKLLKNVAKQAR